MRRASTGCLLVCGEGGRHWLDGSHSPVQLAWSLLSRRARRCDVVCCQLMWVWALGSCWTQKYRDCRLRWDVRSRSPCSKTSGSDGSSPPLQIGLADGPANDDVQKLILSQICRWTIVHNSIVGRISVQGNIKMRQKIIYRRARWEKREACWRSLVVTKLLRAAHIQVDSAASALPTLSSAW